MPTFALGGDTEWTLDYVPLTEGMSETPVPQQTQPLLESCKVFMCMPHVLPNAEVPVSRTNPCPHEASCSDFIKDSDVFNCIHAQQHLLSAQDRMEKQEDITSSASVGTGKPNFGFGVVAEGKWSVLDLELRYCVGVTLPAVQGDGISNTLELFYSPNTMILLLYSVHEKN